MIEFLPDRVAAMGLNCEQIFSAIAAQNVVRPAGVITTGQENIAIRVSGSFEPETDLLEVSLVANGRMLRLGDIGTIRRTFVDPPQSMLRVKGKPAIALAISMADGGDILELGAGVEAAMEDIIADLPLGIEPILVSNQPQVVDQAIGEFTESLWQAVAIILAVSFVSLGARPGTVVAIAIPLTLVIVFVVMQGAGIDLQRISLGALIIALGLLVDDAMTTIDAMLRRLTSAQVASILNTAVSGTTVSRLRDDIYLIPIVARADEQDRVAIDRLATLQVPGPGGRTIALSQFATFSYDQEQPLLWCRDRVPTLTVLADTAPGATPESVVDRLQGEITAFGAQLAPGYEVEIAGTVSESAESQASVFAVIPVMLFLIVTLLMIQLKDFRNMGLVIFLLPLGLIGVVAVLLLFGRPLGFVAILGILALNGMIAKNAVILITQISEERAVGLPVREAVIRAASNRFRPLLLTALSTVLGLMPIAPTLFWGPMAFATVGGLLVATVLTLVLLPTVYTMRHRDGTPAQDNA